MKKIMDLSYEVFEGMPVYPGDCEVKLSLGANYEEDGYTSYILNSCMHVGTHIDVPMHITEDGRCVSEFEVERFVGSAVILDVRNESAINYRKEFEEIIEGVEIILLCTGYNKYYGEAKYYDEHPVLSEELVDCFIRNNIKLVGMDMPSPDRFPYHIHKRLLSNDICILENLCNLEKLLNKNQIEIFALPLKMRSEASLVRAIALYV